MRTTVIRGHALERTGAAAAVVSRRWPMAIGTIVAAAWLIIVATSWAGAADSLHHHALITALLVVSTGSIIV